MTRRCLDDANRQDRPGTGAMRGTLQIGRSDGRRSGEPSYENILVNRNDVAHKEGSNATMRDVKQYYEEGHVVLDYFRDALRGEGDAAGRGVPS